LLPVYLFAISQAPHIKLVPALLAFVILHLLVYPSSNGYNSYIDRDSSSIGGLQKPLQPTKQLYYVTIVMDIAAIVLSMFVSFIFAVGIAIYIVASRLYSGPPVRLKRLPYAGFLVVFFCQGALVFFLTYNAVTGGYDIPLIPMIISSCLIGALYPLTQVYQHTEDQHNGITSISMVLGKRGSFLFSAVLFIAAVLLLRMHLKEALHLNHFYLFLLVTIPVLAYFFFWMAKVWRDARKADFKHSLWMNVIATVCTGAYFLTLIILNQ
jgi:1,4-dihydroxy-2-naphthoate octaprenyltransferase